MRCALFQSESCDITLFRVLTVHVYIHVYVLEYTCTMVLEYVHVYHGTHVYSSTRVVRTTLSQKKRVYVYHWYTRTMAPYYGTMVLEYYVIAS